MTDSLKEAIARKGWEMKFPGYIPFDLEAAEVEFEHAYARGLMETDYENVASLGLPDIAQWPIMRGMFESVCQSMRIISHDLQFEKLWLVTSKAENIHPDVVPFVPHIDKRRYVKAMVYLDEVGEDEGPFTVADCPPDSTDALRRTFGPDYKERRQNVISAITRSAYRPCTGPAGTVIFFDTNCPHFAGHVSGSGRRRVFRFDFTERAWNKDPMGRRLIRASQQAWERLSGAAGN